MALDGRDPAGKKIFFLNENYHFLNPSCPLPKATRPVNKPVTRFPKGKRDEYSREMEKGHHAREYNYHRTTSLNSCKMCQERRPSAIRGGEKTQQIKPSQTKKKKKRQKGQEVGQSGFLVLCVFEDTLTTRTDVGRI
jgi:hypothetical protein